MPFDSDRFPFGDPFPFISSDAHFSPGQLPNLFLWLDANDLSTLFQDSAGTTAVTSNNDPVGRWADKSGSGRHFLQATSGSRPLYKTNQDGTPGVKFDEVDDWLEFLLPIGAGFEIYLIAHATRSSFPGPANNSDPNLTSGIGGGTTLEISFYNGFATTANAALITQQMTNRWLDGDGGYTGAAISSNDTHIGSGTAGSPVSNTGFYMGKYSDNVHYTPDAIKGLIVYSNSHTDAERAMIHKWAKLAGRYGI